MPRKPNYKFERKQREIAKAEKKAEKMKAKAERSQQARSEAAEAGQSTDTPDAN